MPPTLSDESAGGVSSPEALPDAPPALADLRAVVRRAASEIEHLRKKSRRLEEENERLRERVAQLEADPGAAHDGATLLLEDDPEALRERIDRFIDAIDAHL